MTQTIELQINGMSCASCVGRVEKTLLGTDGVSRAVVNLVTETANVTFDEQSTDATAIAKIVTTMGYPATAKTNNKLIDKTSEMQELARMTMFAAVLALPVFVMEMGGHIFPSVHHYLNAWIGTQTLRMVQFALTSIILFGPGLRFFTKGIPALFRGAPEMNALVAMGTGAAYLFSTVATFAPQTLPNNANNVYFESAAVIVVLILFGRWLESRAKGQTGSAIRALIALSPKMARVERDGAMIDIPITDIQLNDIIHARPGEKIATDGVVINGQSYVNESMITGEPAPVKKSSDQPVIGGTINENGTFSYRATAVGDKTMLAQIIKMVEQAQGAKLPIQDIVDRVITWFVPAVLMISLLTAGIWLIFGPTPSITNALVAGVAVLIIACPCAMGLATPTSIMVGTGRAAQMGVLFRQGGALQTLQQVDMIAFDKTGTLTLGNPMLTDIHVVNGFSQSDVLSWVAGVECVSEHPIARAIVTHAQDHDIKFDQSKNFQSLTGMGVTGDVSNRCILIGAARLMESNGIETSNLREHSNSLAADGKTPIYVAVDETLAAIIAVSDPIKPTAQNAIQMLHDMGIKTAMITGDHHETANAIASMLGIDHIVAEVLPDGKVDALQSLRGDAQTIAFVGDGINDAPALASADIGIAIGTGTDVAIETGDVVLMNGDPMGVVNAIEISKHTMRNIHQNLFWAFGYNILLIPVAAGVLYPAFGILLSPVLAAGAMALSSIFVLTNALRLRFIGTTNGA
ncbi:copper-translocating P-type ATPase [Amylibacter ulvae]|uniref:Copper-translocating P-type ATPase n=1 Tax=Paramylibacter ulvae TaxID=1651968 RepID=A0ABQ3CT83_9RHOB|nr:heavy metal translocating P-type ATPase [Amylibacter ulvae]GHA41877.1 copper-translocating P-type ATPase [Amylibacter ulvae]